MKKPFCQKVGMKTYCNMRAVSATRHCCLLISDPSLAWYPTPSARPRDEEGQGGRESNEGQGGRESIGRVSAAKRGWKLGGWEAEKATNLSSIGGSAPNQDTTKLSA